MMKIVHALFFALMIVSLNALVGCGGVETEDELASSEDAVKYVGIDGSNQECATCTCGTDSLGNCVVNDAMGNYYAMCSSCSANAYGGVTYTPVLTRPARR